tara:strand:+ start:205 stop:354 length:150 start_codon:yes stop_codon:yes gene_type:complete
VEQETYLLLVPLKDKMVDQDNTFQEFGLILVEVVEQVEQEVMELQGQVV